MKAIHPIHLIAPGLFLLMTSSRVLYAFPHEFVETRASTQAEMEQAIPIRLRIEGTLSCSAGAENKGQACSLHLKDNQTGRTYQLVGEKTGDVMKIFQSGTKNVAIEGRLGEGQTFEVHTTQAL